MEKIINKKIDFLNNISTLKYDTQHSRAQHLRDIVIKYNKEIFKSIKIQNQNIYNFLAILKQQREILRVQVIKTNLKMQILNYSVVSDIINQIMDECTKLMDTINQLVLLYHNYKNQGVNIQVIDNYQVDITIYCKQAIEQFNSIQQITKLLTLQLLSSQEVSQEIKNEYIYSLYNMANNYQINLEKIAPEKYLQFLLQ